MPRREAELREFIEFLKILDAAYPAHAAIHLILDNHPAHVSRETQAWLAEQPADRFEFTFTPKHGSWHNLWPPWTTSTTIRSFTHGPTSSTTPHDMIRTSETLT